MRKASDIRKTKETSISAELNLDGQGFYQIDTSIPFMNHMLELFAKHGYFDLTIEATGDKEVDDLFIIEDLGIILGNLLKKAVGDKKGINRYGSMLMPMDEALILISIDLCNRPYLSYDVSYQNNLKNFDYALIKEFLAALVNHSGMTLHVRMIDGENTHHIIEAIFKGLSRALRIACDLNDRENSVPSTKGII